MPSFLPFESVINTTSFRLASSKQMAATIDHRQRRDGKRGPTVTFDWA